VMGQGQAFIPGVGKTEEEKRAEIEGEMPADGKPEVARAPDGQAEEKRDKRYAQTINQRFLRLHGKVENESEEQRKEDGCRPEPDSRGQSKKFITSKDEFLKETSDEESQCPDDRVGKRRGLSIRPAGR